jgi:hypothetical protein
MANQEFGEDFIKQVEEEISKLVINRADSIVLETHNVLTILTPVDTGQARAGWNVSLNTPNYSVPKKPLKDRQGNLVFGKLTPSSPKPDRQMKKIGGKYFIVNAVQHIVPLNEGHSQQRPDGFIEKGIYTAVKKFD